MTDRDAMLDPRDPAPAWRVAPALPFGGEGILGWARFAGLALLVGACVWISIDFTRVGGVSTVWLANGLMIGLLLLRQFGRWPRLLAAAATGEFVARFAHGDPALLAIAWGGLDLLEVLVCAGAIRHVVPDITDREKLVPLSLVATTSAVVAAALSSSIGAAFVAHFRDVPYQQALMTAFTAHVLGIVIVATMTVVALRERFAVLGRAGERIDFSVCIGLVATTAAAVFLHGDYPLLFLTFLPLLLVAFRHGFAGVVVGIGLIAVIAFVATTAGFGPIAPLATASPLAVNGVLQLYVAACCLFALPVAVALSERARLSARLRHSESRYRLLAEHTRDLVVRLRGDGRPQYVSRSVTAMLGYDPEDLLDPHDELIHPEDRQFFCDNLARLCRHGGSATMTYRVQHRDGHYLWIEALAERVASTDPAAPAEVVYSGRDVTARVAAEHALMESQSRLQAVTDNVPGMIAHVDTSLRYTFVNATLAAALNRPVDAILGRSIREVRGDAFDRVYAPYFAAALRGESPSFEGEIIRDGKSMHFKSHYVPDRGADGQVRGFYALTYDITALKEAERELERLARVDTLTGLANRRAFDERMALALARTRRRQLPLAMLSFDVDRFKVINDTHGHAAGDEVLRVFAQRLRDAVYDEDVVARLGGDEFVVLIENVGSPEMAELIARKLIHAMRDPVMIGDVPLAVSTSVGIGFASGHTTAAALAALADKALYAAKAAGRNAYRLACDDE